MSKCILRSPTSLFVISISQNYVFVIQTSAIETASVEIRGIVSELLRSRNRKFPAGIEVTEQDVGNSIASLVTTISSLDDSWGISCPWHGYRRAREIDHHNFETSSRNTQYQIVDVRRKGLGFTVIAFTFPCALEIRQFVWRFLGDSIYAYVDACANDRNIRIACRFFGPLNPILNINSGTITQICPATLKSETTYNL
jgi:hypothetical protein